METAPPDLLAPLPWPLRTDRLVLRRLGDGDAERLWEHRGLPEVSRWLGGASGSLEDHVEFFADPRRVAQTLVVEHDGAVVGDLYVNVMDGWAQREVAAVAVRCQAEIGWTLNPAAQGRGLGTEAVRALLEVCFSPAPSGLGLRRVVAECFALNEPSWRLMERVGMRREHHAVRESLHRDLGWVDGYGYALLAEE